MFLSHLQENVLLKCSRLEKVFIRVIDGPQCDWSEQTDAMEKESEDHSLPYHLVLRHLYVLRYSVDGHHYVTLVQSEHHPYIEGVLSYMPCSSGSTRTWCDRIPTKADP